MERGIVEVAAKPWDALCSPESRVLQERMF